VDLSLGPQIQSNRDRVLLALLSSRPPKVSTMLVLSRKKNESIVIDERIVITVIEIRGDKVRLGIEAPRDVAIHRHEIYESLKRMHQDGELQAAPDVPVPDRTVNEAAPQE
jgi:carbon storage regulator (csrA)